MAGVRFKMLSEIQVMGRQPKIVLMGTWLLRSKHSNEGLKFQVAGQTSSKGFFHQTPDYPAIKHLPLPSNIKELTSENLKFSPHRTRDISGSFISSASAPAVKDLHTNVEPPADERISCYDCSGTVNLSSVMQTNVPFPFVSKGKPYHLNMPGGQWGREEKYLSEDLNNAHHTNSDHFHSTTGGSFLLSRKTGTKSFLRGNHARMYCTEKNKVDITSSLHEKNSTANVTQLSNKEKLKAAVKDYGVVVILFHVGISLVSLGCCYLIIASGIDLPEAFKHFGADEGAATAGNAARFIIAYALHKTLAPGRIAITLTAVPFIVRKLRKMGLLKTPQPKHTSVN